MRNLTIDNFINPTDCRFRSYNPETDIINHFNLTSFSKDFKNITRSINEKDIEGTEIFEGDIVTWPTGMFSIEGLPEDIAKKANETFNHWYENGRNNGEDYDYEANGWYRKYNTGVVVFYKGAICVHNDFSTDYHEKNSKYSGTTYFGNFQKNKDYKVIGNVYRNLNLLKSKNND